MAAGNNKSVPKFRKLLDLLHDKRSLLIVMQDNPDPDSIASAAALRRLANAFGEVQCSITYGGVIGRAENQALVNYLGLNFRPIEQVDPKKFDAVALVDTQPSSGNNSLPEDVLADIVLDHHPLLPRTRSVAFTDVRSKYGALSTILFQYLQQAGLVPDPPLATALLYAIRTDTQDLGPESIQADIEAVEKLYPLANTRMLSVIQRGYVDRSYFQTLALALKRARVQGTTIFADLGDVDAPDNIAEMADLFLRYQEAAWSLCSGFYEDKMWLSLRTSQAQITAGEMMRFIISEMGTGGGHEMSAGGQIPLGKGTLDEKKNVVKTVRQRFLRRAGAKGERSTKLVQVD